MTAPDVVGRYRIDGVVATVDTVNGAHTLDVHPEAICQIAAADRLLLTKTDLVSGEACRGSRRGLRKSIRLRFAATFETGSSIRKSCSMQGCSIQRPDRRTS